MARTLAEALREKLLEVMQERGWSQRDLAARLDVEQSTISYLLGGKRRSRGLDLYAQIASVCGLTLSDLCRNLEWRVARSSVSGSVYIACQVKPTADVDVAAVAAAPPPLSTESPDAATRRSLPDPPAGEIPGPDPLIIEQLAAKLEAEIRKGVAARVAAALAADAAADARAESRRQREARHRQAPSPRPRRSGTR